MIREYLSRVPKTTIVKIGPVTEKAKFKVEKKSDSTLGSFFKKKKKHVNDISIISEHIKFS